MKTNTATQILEHIRINGLVRPADLVRLLSLSPQAVHAQIRKLLASNKIARRGKPPYTVYALSDPETPLPNLPATQKKLLESEFSYLDPKGTLYFGIDAYKHWVNAKSLAADFVALAKAYEKMWLGVYGEKRQTPIDTLNRLRSILPDLVLNSAVISDFYALPQFGKTKLGNLVHAGKTSPQPEMMELIFSTIKSDLAALLRHHLIDAVCFVPHSIPRLRPFLPDLRRKLNLSLPEFDVRKVFAGSVPVPQKSLSKLSERIENAQKTIYIEKIVTDAKSILIIDDAIGSGATINELAKLLKIKTGCKHVHAYAIVGSYKGFDVISQV